MKIAILTSENSSTYVYNLAAGLFDAGFTELTLVNTTGNSGTSYRKNLRKLYRNTFSERLLKFIDLICAFNRWNRIERNIRKVPFKSFQDQGFIEFFSRERFDIAIAYNTGLLSERIVSIPKFGIICAHPALLPFGRGCYGHLQSVLADVPLGVSVFRINHGIDTGDIYLQEKLDISRCRNMYDLKKEFSKKELDLTLKTVLRIGCHNLHAKRQEGRHKYKKLQEEEINKANELLRLLFLENRKKQN